MHARHRIHATLAGGAAAFVAALWLLSGGRGAPAAGAHLREAAPARTASGTVRTPSAARPRAAYADPRSPAADRGGNAAAPAADSLHERARDLLRRIEGSTGSGVDLPEDLQRDLLAFLSAGAEERNALFGLAWDPASPRMVLGHLRVFLARLADPEARRTLLAAFDAFNPRAAALADAAARAKDPELFVASLRAAASAKERLDLMKSIPQASLAEPRLAAWLLEAAQRDPDEAVRCLAYGELAVSASRAAVPVLAAAAGDAGRSPVERGAAAFALGNHPDAASAGDLLRLYEEGSVDVRRNLLTALARAPSDRRVDDLLLEAVTSADAPLETRKAAAYAIGERLPRLPQGESRDLGTRTAAAVKALPADDAVEVLTSLGGSVVKNEPLREAIQDLRRTAPAGGPIQLAIVNVPALRFVAAMN